MSEGPLYIQWANYYLKLIEKGSIKTGERMPSIRTLVKQHNISVTTALQVYRHLEDLGWLQTKNRSGYFLQTPPEQIMNLIEEPDIVVPDPAQYIGIHKRVSEFIAKTNQHPVKVNLSGAHAAPSLYLAQEMKINGSKALRDQPDLLVKPPSFIGNPHFRKILARRAISSGLAINADEILITQGGTQALNLALKAVTQPGDTVAIESPTFYGLLQILESLDLRAVEIPTNTNTGISLEAFELASQVYKIKAVVVMPNLQNPLGSIMPEMNKRKLAFFCQEQGIAIIEDDTFGSLMDNETPINALKAWDHSGNVIYCASLTKTLAPGLRIGWMSAGRWHARVQMLRFTQTRSNEEWPQVIAAEVMGASKYNRHLQALRKKIKNQKNRIKLAVATYFPLGTRLASSDGGMTLWIELPEKISADMILEIALQEGILFAPGSLFSNSNRFNHCLRINCGYPYTDEIDNALKQLGLIIKTAMK
ncbi:PLP-dependent aminotransferase family protein [Acinetobacter pittii]|uniref:aminotransferase-like domain-containing protein n=1 Tax=Acinetobacter pittii TaxID=48296 RepID=UPI002A74FA05|nr:PLP-dependent aminotransferase family protein [Acinetobacter pittii]WPP87176.1 PLP-dependent aminotransferase family protein [Acinetobacter pittii]